MIRDKIMTHVSDGDGGGTADSVDVLAKGGDVGTGGGSRADSGQSVIERSENALPRQEIFEKLTQ
jgi:hypothetical protein